MNENIVLLEDGTEYSHDGTLQFSDVTVNPTTGSVVLRALFPAEEASAEAPEPNAFEKLVDRLLESPHYGERWARRWLDLARYADTTKPLLLVVGSHGESGFQPVAMGTTASQITLHGRFPVLLVNPGQVLGIVEGDDQPERGHPGRLAGTEWSG